MLRSEDCLICEEAKCIEDAYLPSLHLSTVELRCKLQEKLPRVTSLLGFKGHKKPNKVCGFL